MRRPAVFLTIVAVAVSLAGGGSARENNDHFIYLSPVPGARYVSPQSTLIFRPAKVLFLGGGEWTSRIKVVGSLSGEHRGDWVTADDSYTVIFRPRRDFELGEAVTVSLFDGDTQREGPLEEPFSYVFEITKRVPDYEPDLLEQLDTEDEAPVKVDEDHDSRLLGPGSPGALTLPDDFPPMNITTCDDPGDGYIFAAYNPSFFDRRTRPYMMILKNDGTPVFFRRMRRNTYDFKKQPNGMLSYLVMGTQKFFVMDDTYTVVDSFRSQDGYPLDLHEFQMLPNGHVLLIANDVQIIDMSVLVAGGDTAAIVTGNVIQELDQSKNLVFQWRTFDHYDILDSDVSLTTRRIGYSHVNAIELDHDGNIMISARHMSEVTKIDRQTGEMIWRMGGKKNQFTLVNDTQLFSRQHDIRRLPNGHITVFDNGNLNDPRESRAIEYIIDEQALTATLVWEYRHDPMIYSAAMGNAQRLPGGNTVIGWGSRALPNITEVHPDGTVAFELGWPRRGTTYRAFRFPWEGVAEAPFAWADSTDQVLSLNFMVFGDPCVEKYYVYRGDSSGPMKKVAVTKTHSVTLHDFSAGDTIYLRVTAVDCDMDEGPFSNELALVPSFSDSLPMMAATLEISPKTLNKASQGRWISARIGFPGESGYTASDVDVTSIMLNDTLLIDHHGNIEVGNDVHNKKDLTVKFLRDEVAAVLPEGEEVPVRVRGVVGEHAFEAVDYVRVFCSEDGCAAPAPPVGSGAGQTVSRQNYPNPFNPATVIRFSLRSPARVTLKIYDSAGRLVKVLVDGELGAGDYEKDWNGTDRAGNAVASGVYFYRLAAGEFTETRKMVLLR